MRSRRYRLRAADSSSTAASPRWCQGIERGPCTDGAGSGRMVLLRAVGRPTGDGFGGSSAGRGGAWAAPSTAPPRLRRMKGGNAYAMVLLQLLGASTRPL